MAIKIHDVLNYLERHPVCSQCGDVDTLMGMLREIYILHDRQENEQADVLFARFSAYCREREQLAFSQGVVVGMQLMTEVNWTQ